MTSPGYLKGGAFSYDIDELTIYDAVVLPTYNPIPVLTSLSPSSANAGGSSFTLTAIGGNFINGSVIRFDGVNLATTYVDSAHLTATVSSAQIALTGNHTITVYSGFPGGGTSSGSTLSVVNALPTISSTTPSYIYFGTGAQTLVVNGTGFVTSSAASWSNLPRTTTYVSSTQLNVSLLAPDVASVGSYGLRVNNPTPGGGTSTVFTVQVQNPTPSISGVSPTSFAVQSGDSLLNVTGSGFSTSTVVRWGGTDLATSYTDASHLGAVVPSALLSQIATVAVTTFNPAPGGGSSTSTSVSVEYKTPTIVSLSQANVAAGGAGFQLGLTGTGFTTSTAVYWDGSPRTMVFQDVNTVRMQVTASDIATGGTHAISAGNPSPAGISASSSFDVLNPSPAIASLSSTSTVAGSPDLALTLVGSGFVPSSTVAWDGVSVSTVYQNGNQLTATIPASRLTLGGTFPVTVNNPGPGGGTSGSVSFYVQNPLPTLSAIDPAQTQTGTGTIQVLLTGTDFVSSSVGRWDGSALATTYVNPTSIQVNVPSSLTASGGTHAIDVSNPTPGGGISASRSFTVYDSIATTTGIVPDHADAGMPGFVLTVNGTGFNASSVVRWNGVDLPTTYINDAQLSADVAAGDISDGGSVPVTVYNPGPGGGLSNAQTFTIYNPSPTISVISPSSANQGAAGVSLTITGTGFTSSTVMRWNGSDRSTVVASSTSIAATVTAADLSSAGNASVTVFNPAPGGGTSGAAVFFVNARPAQPTNVSPAPNVYGVPLDATLQASAFSDSDFGDTHASSVWEITSAIGDYSSPIYSTTTYGSSVTVTVPAGILSRNHAYGWHVRYIDQSGAASPFSAETIFYTPTPPNQPVNVTPVNSETGVSLTPTLTSSAFTDPDPGHSHASSYWEITATPGDYSSPVMAVTSTVDLTSILVSSSLSQGATYGWHVRYVGMDGDYSQFSPQTVFTTLTVSSGQPVQSSYGGSAPPSIPAPTILGGSYVSSTVIRWTFRNFSPFVTSFSLTNDAGAQVTATGTGLIGVDQYIDEPVTSSFGVCGRSLTAISPFGNSVAATFPCAPAFGTPSVSPGYLPLQVVTSTEETMVFRWASSTADLSADHNLYGIRISDFNEWLKPAGMFMLSLASAPADSCDSDFTISSTPVFMTKSDWGPCFTLVDTTTTKDVTVQLFSKGSLGDDPKLVSSFLATLLKGSPKLTATKKILDIQVAEGPVGRLPVSAPVARSFGAVVLLATLSSRVRRRLQSFLMGLKSRFQGWLLVCRRFIHFGFAKTYVGLSLALMVFGVISIIVQNQVRSTASTIVPTHSTVTYEITVGNQGTRSARNVKLVDEFPPEGTYVAGSFTMDGVPLTSEADGDAGSVTTSSASVVWLRFPAGESHVLRIGLAFDGIVEDFSNGAELSSDEASDSFKSTCGNGALESKEYTIDGKKTVVGEVCDEGDLNGTPGHCSQNCKGLTPLCGNGLAEPVFAMTAFGYQNVGEACDDGTDKNGKLYGYCTADCKGTYIPADFVCGNGQVNSYNDYKQNRQVTEFCDDGLSNGQPGKCSADCKSILPMCGNGYTDKGEFCDDGLSNGQPGKCSMDCRYVMWTCGNGEVEKRYGQDGKNFGEACDDGTDKNGKFYGYCTADCKGTFIPADFVCGNGKVNSYKDYRLDKEISELCDDGDLNGKPGHCAKDCKSILPMCGNGKVEAVEKCDEGAANGKPGHCAADCTRILGDCGNGISEPFMVESTSGKVNVGESCDDGDPDPTKPHIYEKQTVYAKDGMNGKLYGYCSADCKGPYIPADFVCGNGKVNSYKDYRLDKEISELCDDGELNGKPGHCARDCKSILPICGNGQVEATEKCDEGNINGQPGHCAKDCSRVLGDCGNGIYEPFFIPSSLGLPVNIGESCDQGDPDPTKPHLYKNKVVYATGGTNGTGYGFCKADCSGLDVPATCGNFKVDGWTDKATGVEHPEVCDDGSDTQVGPKGLAGQNGHPGFCTMKCDGSVPVCGNAKLEAGEFCDEGDAQGIFRYMGSIVDTSTGMNGLPGHCSRDCKRILEDCGNAVVEPYFKETALGRKNVAESCDDGDPDPTKPHLYNGQTVFAKDGMNGKLYGYCAADCKGTYIPADFVCGNGQVNSYTDYKKNQTISENCDDGKLNGKPGHCSSDCRTVLAMCGNGTVEGDEVCDSGPESDLDIGICKFDCSGYIDEAYLLLLKNRVKLSKRYLVNILPIDENASGTQEVISPDELPPDPQYQEDPLFAIVDESRMFRMGRDASGAVILPPGLLSLEGKEFAVLSGRDLIPGTLQTSTSTIPHTLPSATSSVAAGVVTALRDSVTQPVADVGTALAVSITLASLALAVGPSLWTLLLMLLTQPTLLLGRPKAGAYGLVLNSLTQLPEPFAIVRLRSSVSQKIIKTMVTDRTGRYLFLAQAGAYILEVTKKGFTYPTRLFRPGDKDAEGQALLVDPLIEQAESGSIIRHVPIDPIEAVGEPLSLNRQKLLAAARVAFAGLGPVVSLCMALLRPSVSTLSVVAVQALLFAFFWIVARPRLPRSFATVKDESGKPLSLAVVRLFSKRFNKLVDMQVTDRSGHYAFLAGPGDYLLTVEKPGFATTVVEVSKQPGEKTVTAQDVGLVPQAEEPPAA